MRKPKRNCTTNTLRVLLHIFRVALTDALLLSSKEKQQQHQYQLLQQQQKQQRKQQKVARWFPRSRAASTL